MTVVILIGARTKYFLVTLLRPGRVVQLVRCVEVFFSAYKNHFARIAALS